VNRKADGMPKQANREMDGMLKQMNRKGIVLPVFDRIMKDLQGLFCTT